MQQPLVTIITITYNLLKANRKEMFLQCVESIRNQTYPNIEHIIIDGASDDGSIELFKELGLKFYSEPDKGIYDAFNKGIMRANGKYINFMNSDDFFNNNDAASLSVKALEKTNADFSYAPANVLKENDEFDFVYKPNMRDVLTRMPFIHQTMFTKTSVMKQENMFDLAFKSASDYDFILRLTLANYKSTRVNENIVSFRYTGISKSDKKTSILEQVAILKKNYTKYCPLSDETILNIFIHGKMPYRLLFKLGFRGFFPLLNAIRADLISFKKKLIRMRISKDYGMLELFGISIIKPKTTYAHTCVRKKSLESFWEED